MSEHLITSLNAIPSNSELTIFGYGKQARKLEVLIKGYYPELSLTGFIDDNVISPQTVTFDDYLAQREHNTLLIPGNSPALVQKAREKNIDNYFVLHDHIDPVHTFNPDERDYPEWQSKVNSTCSGLATKEEALLYQRLFELRSCNHQSSALADKNIVTYPEDGDHYFDYINYDAIETAIDGGMWDGNHSRMFLESFPNIKKLYGFELNAEFYLKGGVDYRLGENPKFHFVPKGLWSEDKEFTIDLDGPATCINQRNKGKRVAVTYIDGFAEKEDILKLDYLKLDVEGAEPEVLKGASKTLVKDRPQLAISIYHTRYDFIEIPLYLMNLLNNYVFRLGHYSNGFTETVLYGIPQELEKK